MDEMQWVRESWRDTLALTEDWMKSKEFEEMAAQKQYRNPLQVGMTVRIVGEEYHGQVGELRVIEPDFYGVYLDAAGDIVFFLGDEIERVENVDMAELPF